MKACVTLLLVVTAAACAREQSEPVDKPKASSTFTTPELSRAESLYFAAEYDSAARIWRAALASDSVRKDSAAQAHILMWLGMREWRLGNYDSARTIGERSLALKLRLGRTRELSRSYNSLGLIARDEGRLVEAQSLFLKAMETAKAVDDTAGINRGAINLALIQQDLGAFNEAQKGFEVARDAGKALGDARLEGNALNNLAALLIRMGDPASAIPLLHDAVDRYNSIEYHTGLQNSIGQLATAYDALGDSRRAFALLDTASRMAEAQGLKQEQENNLRIFGELYQAAGDHRRALDFFSRARVLSDSLGLGQETGIILRAEARSQLALGRNDLAIARMKEALRSHQAQKAAFEEMVDLLSISEIDSGREARREIDAARKIAQTINTPAARADLALGEARLDARTFAWRQLLAVLQSANADIKSARLSGSWEPYALRARAYAALGILDSAVVSGRAAVAASERVRSRIGTGSLRTSFTSERSQVYADLVIALLRMNRIGEAFEVADAARGRELLEHLAQARNEPGVKDLAERERILRQIDEITRLLNEADRVPQRERAPFEEQRLNALSGKLARLETDYEGLVTRTSKARTAAADVLGVRAVSLTGLNKVLDPGEALVEYVMMPDRLVVFVARRDRFFQMSVNVSGDDVAARVRVARGVAGKRDAEVTDNSVFRGLYELLIAPMEKAGAFDNVTRIVVVPQGSLLYLPFAALMDAKNRYLSDRFALLYAPSASAVMTLRTKAEGQKPPRRAVVLAPFPQLLPSTVSEATEVRRSLSASRALIGDKADENALRDALSSASIVHVASHGVLNRRNPLFSRIELARPQVQTIQSSADDGRLDLHEVFGMSVASKLVFLSGCETGVGTAWSTDFAHGDDFATLAQAFLYAGAQEVVATLWRIDDEAAALFASKFYKNLKQMPPADALAAAQADVRRNPKFKAPYYWAAYTVSGSGDRLNLEKRWWNPFN